MIINFIATARGAAAADEPSAEELAAWLATLPMHDPSGAARLLIERLVTLNRRPQGARGRVRLLDMLRERVETLVPRLDRNLAGAALPLAPPLRETAYLIEKLLKELGAGYAAAVTQTPRAWLAFGLKRQIQAPLAHAIDLAARRLALTHRLYARSPGGIWAELHLLYGLARELALDQREPEPAGRSPAVAYRDALLIAFAEPARLMSGELALVQDYLARFGSLAELVDAAPDAKPRGVFVIDPRRDRPGVAAAKRKEGDDAPGARFLVTRALVERIESQFVRLQSGVSPDTLGLPESARSVAYRALMRRLAANWRGDKRRRSARLRFHPRVDVQFGLGEAWDALGSASPCAPARTASEWVIANESAAGFALRLMSGAAGQVAVGDVVLVRSRERGRHYLCMVRRVVSNNPDHLEIGLQQLAPRVHAAVATLEPGGRGEALKVLFCPALPARNQPAMLVVADGARRSRRELYLKRAQGLAPVRVQRVAERTTAVELLEIGAA
ncbi:MAG: hypothetical protein N2544_08550 [Burkholderiales bacterium]|nr:hypothetical protein [Burkholderiales bacterium]